MSSRPDYRPDIDGLRAVAVLPVVLYHYGATWLPGGFTGVDVFFVISGFVITAKLRKDISAGEFSVLGFYDGRVRRIFPALLTMLAVTMIAGWFILAPGDYSDLGESAAYAALGLGNLFFYRNTGYFDQAAELQPLLHTWSLGVEEQFYALWPLLLFVGLRFMRRRAALMAILFAAVVGGIVYAEAKLGRDPKGAFYLPHPRAWELGLGALMVFLPAIGSRVASEGAALLGTALTAYGLLNINADGPFPGINAAYACFGAALLVWPKLPTVAARVLSVRPVVFVGLISYSLYLWHWPVLVLCRHYLNGAMPDPFTASELIVLSFVLAWLSWQFIEAPFRYAAGWGRWHTIIGGFTSAGVIVLLGLSLHSAEGVTARITPAAREVADLDLMWEWPCNFVHIDALGSKFCNFGPRWNEANSRGIIWGDSHAQHIAPLLEQFAQDHKISFAVVTPCPAALGGSVRREWPEVPTYVTDCETVRRKVFSAIHTDERISTLVLAGSWNRLAGFVSSDEKGSGHALVVRGLREVLEAVGRDNLGVVFVDQVPEFPFDPVPCAFAATSGLLRAPCQGLGTSSYYISMNEQSAQFPGLRDLAADYPKLRVVHPRERMCGHGACMVEFEGYFIFRDAGHLRRNLPLNVRADLAAYIGLTDALQGSSTAGRETPVLANVVGDRKLQPVP